MPVAPVHEAVQGLDTGLERSGPRDEMANTVAHLHNTLGSTLMCNTFKVTESLSYDPHT